ncbi:MAG TPA: hypothetical protein VNW06_08490 [Cytophagaceae bacterium]|nr:hypothetical protein [Cytophagaceae bacterium]
MKKNKLNIVLSLSLLALMLVGRVGIHIFHHHDSFSRVESVALKKSNPSAPILSTYHSEVDCALCKLDTFQEVFSNAVTAFVFFLVFGKPVYQFLLEDSVQFLVAKKSRGPPFILSIA